jgi:pectin methylesterase-like acyl-CoA thioesterase
MNNFVFILFCFLLVNDSFSKEGSDTNYFIVAKDGSGDFTSIQNALDKVPSGIQKYFTIYVKEGNYNEKIYVERSKLIICGENRLSSQSLEKIGSEIIMTIMAPLL